MGKPREKNIEADGPEICLLRVATRKKGSGKLNPALHVRVRNGTLPRKMSTCTATTTASTSPRSKLSARYLSAKLFCNLMPLPFLFRLSSLLLARLDERGK